MKGDTLAKIKEKFKNFDNILNTNQFIYLMPDQVLIFEKNER